MKEDDPLFFVLDYILNQATTAELDVIAEAVKRRSGTGKAPAGMTGGISPRGMAQNLAKSVQKQLNGLMDVRQIARKIVNDLVRQKEPGISDQELEVLLNNWLPEKGTSSGPGAVPPDVLVTMVAQYVAAKRGTLPANEERELPQEWNTRYWGSFPAEVRTLISDLLEGKLAEVAFWERLIEAIQR